MAAGFRREAHKRRAGVTGRVAVEDEAFEFRVSTAGIERLILIVVIVFGALG
jgi:hypothetical protein